MIQTNRKMLIHQVPLKAKSIEYDPRRTLARQMARSHRLPDFLETNHRKPSKFIPEERNLRSWWKHNKKLMNAGELKPERVQLFKQLLALGEKYKHVNQYM